LSVAKKSRYRIEWRQKARDDLRDIVRFIGKDSPVRAKTFGKELRDTTKPLAEFPNMGRSGRPGLPDWLRELVAHKNYIIFYRVLDKSRTVEILRVKHAAQQTP